MNLASKHCRLGSAASIASVRKIRDSAVEHASGVPGEAIFSLSLESVTVGNRLACLPV
jgi:hypothetical protein